MLKLNGSGHVILTENERPSVEIDSMEEKIVCVFHCPKIKRTGLGCDIDSNQLLQLIANLILGDKDSIATLTLDNFKEHSLYQELVSSLRTLSDGNTDDGCLLNTRLVGGRTTKSYDGIIRSVLEIDKIFTSCNSNITFDIISADSMEKGCPDSILFDYNGNMTPNAGARLVTAT